MKYTYRIPNDSMGNPSTEFIFRIEDSAWIPTDPANSDYWEYLQSKAKKSTSIDTEDE
jgi:hypothetical protein